MRKYPVGGNAATGAHHLGVQRELQRLRPSRASRAGTWTSRASFKSTTAADPSFSSTRSADPVSSASSNCSRQPLLGATHAPASCLQEREERARSVADQLAGAVLLHPCAPRATSGAASERDALRRRHGPPMRRLRPASLRPGRASPVRAASPRGLRARTSRAAGSRSECATWHPGAAPPTCSSTHATGQPRSFSRLEGESRVGGHDPGRHVEDGVRNDQRCRRSLAGRDRDVRGPHGPRAPPRR